MQQSDISDLEQLVKLVDALGEDLLSGTEPVADLRFPGDMPVGVGVCALRRDISPRSVSDRVTQEAARIQVLREAEDRHVRSGLTMGHVSVLFDETADITSPRIDRMAQELVDACAAHREELFNGRRLSAAADDALPEGIVSLRVCQAQMIRRTCWTGATAQWIDALEIDHVQHALDAGCEQLAAGGEQGSAEVGSSGERWVVLMTESSEWENVPAHVMAHAYESGAHRAFMMAAGALKPEELEVLAVRES